MKKITKFLKIISFIAILTSAYSTSVYSHDHTPRKQLINKLKNQILELGQDPIKKGNPLKADKKYIEELEEQILAIKEEIRKKEEIDEAKKKLISEIENFGSEPVTKKQSFVDTDDEIIALRKQLDELKLQKEIEATKAEIIKELKELGIEPETAKTDVDKNEDIIKLREQLEEVKAQKAKKAEEEKKKEQEKINAAKNELINELEKLGVKPKLDMSGLDDNAEINALKKQIEEVKAERKKLKIKRKQSKRKFLTRKKLNDKKQLKTLKKKFYFLGRHQFLNMNLIQRINILLH